jgi:hypothetical protein
VRVPRRKVMIEFAVVVASAAFFWAPVEHCDRKAPRPRRANERRT